MSLTIKDLEKLQAEHPDYRMELMSPSGYESDEVGTEFARLLGNWVRPRKLGRVTGSSAGFILPNSDLRTPLFSCLSPLFCALVPIAPVQSVVAASGK